MGPKIVYPDGYMKVYERYITDGKFVDFKTAAMGLDPAADGICDKSVIDAFSITKVQDLQISIRHFVAEYGYKIKPIPYKQCARERGRSSYNMSRSLSFAITSLCNTPIKPFCMMTVFGMTTVFASLLVGAFYLVYKLTHRYSFNAGMASLVIGLFFVLLCSYSV